jgi:hypothetical protein
MDLPALATSGKKMKANKVVFHDLLTLPKNETLTPNFSVLRRTRPNAICIPNQCRIPHAYSADHNV